MGLTLAVLFTAACGEPSTGPTTGQQEEKKAYLPISDYLEGEIRKVDSSVAGILKRESANGSAFDSAFITNQQFHVLAQDFLSPELARETFEKSFKENSFYDETTESLTFNYEATDPKVTVRRVDVIIAPSLEIDKIKTIYMEKSYSTGDTAFTKKMTWTAGSEFSIVTIKNSGANSSSVRQVRVVWDPLKY